MRVQVSEVKAGQHIWIRDELRLVRSIRRSQMTGAYTVVTGSGTVVLAADAQVVI
jgi:hypothetical protein